MKLYICIDSKKMRKEELKERIWKIADGVPLKLGRMTIETSKTDKILVTGWTDTIHFENISKDFVIGELRDLKDSFIELIDTYNELKSIVKTHKLTIEYHMSYDDAGKAGIGLCSEIDGIINWYIE